MVFPITSNLVLNELAFIVALVVKLNREVRATKNLNCLRTTVSIQIYNTISELRLNYDRTGKLDFKLSDKL